MNLEDASSLAKCLFFAHGLSEKGWYFKFDRAKNRMGLCSHRKRKISLSSELALKSPVDEVRDTLLHEIAHALVGPGFGHGPVWKRKAKEIGCSANRCHSVAVEYRYITHCALCKKETGKSQRRKRLIHKGCGGRIVYSPYISDSEEARV